MVEHPRSLTHQIDLDDWRAAMERTAPSTQRPPHDYRASAIAHFEALGMTERAAQRAVEGFEATEEGAQRSPKRKPRLLDLYCGAGGAAMGYHRAGFDVVGVDIRPQPNYPFEFHQGDAIEYLNWNYEFFDAVHASPPCQSFTAYRRRGAGVGDSYLNLIPETRTALVATGLPYVIENVPGAPLFSPVTYCGSSFCLDVRRHRLFESNYHLSAPPCDHKWQTPRFPPATNRTNLRSTVEVGVWRIPLETQQKAMGIDWMELRELSESIPPAYTEHIGRQMIEALV